MRIKAITMNPISARRERGPGIRILYFYSVFGLEGEAERSSPAVFKQRWKYISTCLGQYSTQYGTEKPTFQGPKTVSWAPVEMF